MVTAHLRRLYFDARLEVSTMRGQLPLADPPHETSADVHDSCERAVERFVFEVLGGWR